MHPTHLQIKGKKRNVFIYGESNRAKTFVLNPLQCIFNTFKPPDTGSHQLADIKGCELVFLNEWEYDPSFLPWGKLKDFFEGQTMKIAVPKNEGCNYVFSLDSPIVGTTPAPITHWNPKETVQMMNRIVYFEFKHFFDPETCPDIEPCSACCAKLYLAARPGPLLPVAP